MRQLAGLFQNIFFFFLGGGGLPWFLAVNQSSVWKALFSKKFWNFILNYKKKKLHWIKIILLIWAQDASFMLSDVSHYLRRTSCLLHIIFRIVHDVNEIINNKIGIRSKDTLKDWEARRLCNSMQNVKHRKLGEIIQRWDRELSCIVSKPGMSKFFEVWIFAKKAMTSRNLQ